MTNIPFNKPYMTGEELSNIAQAHINGHLAGDGVFTQHCQNWLERTTGARKALLTHSCTAALEMAAILINVQPGDEVIMPSYTFVSTANAFVLRGATIVFVDIRQDTLNIDDSKIEAAITDKTRVIVAVHYAGVGCNMDAIMAIAERHNLFVVEDAAQGLLAAYRGRPLGSIGHLGTVSFHETKNIISGEGGALLINDVNFVERAEIIREKGTDRGRFFRGQVDKYSWVDIGSSYLPGEIIAAFLWAQMQAAQTITHRRLDLWQCYHEAFKDLEGRGLAQRPFLPKESSHNGHMYYLLLKNLHERTKFIKRMNIAGIQCVFHYVPLHLSAFGRKCSRHTNELEHTDQISERLVRLPLWLGLERHQAEVIDQVQSALMCM